MSVSSPPPVARDCSDCGLQEGMKLQNTGGTVPRHIPLLYVCQRCGAMLTIPPPGSPIEPVAGVG